MFATEPPAEPVLQVVLGPDVSTIKVLLNIGIGRTIEVYWSSSPRFTRSHVHMFTLKVFVCILSCPWYAAKIDRVRLSLIVLMPSLLPPDRPNDLELYIC